MKRSVLVLALAACVAGGVFAQSLFSAGAGGILSYAKLGEASASAEAGGQKASVSESYTGLHFCGCVFFDATFVDLSIAILTGTSTAKTEEDMPGSPKQSLEADYTITSLDFTLLGKYPIEISDSFTFFPLLGAGYNYVLSVKRDGKDAYEGVSERSASDWSTFRIHVGVGGDFNFTDKIYLRGQLLGNYAFASKAMKDNAEDGEKYMKFLAESSGVSNPTVSSEANGGFGGTFKIAVGYRF